MSLIIRKKFNLFLSKDKQVKNLNIRKNYISFAERLKTQNLKANMIIVKVEEGETIDRALKRFKRRIEKAGIMREVRERQFYRKPSEIRKEILAKAIYRNRMRLLREGRLKVKKK